VQYAAPSEVYLDVNELRDPGATPDDVAAHLQHLTYRQNLGPYVPKNAIEQDLLDNEEFAAVFAATWLDGLADVAHYGPTSYGGDQTDPGIPPRSLID